MATRSTTIEPADAPASPPNHLRTLSVGLCGVAFLLQLGYAFARPAAESLFLASHTSEELPYAWLLVAVGMPLTVTAYNRFVARFVLVHVVAGVAALSAGVFVTLIAMRAVYSPAADYLLYAWKDIYVVILVEAFYTLTNSVYRIGTARWLYGLFGAAGACGAIAGNLLVGPLALRYGTLTALMTAPLLLVLLAGAAALLGRRLPRRGSPSASSTPPGFLAAAAVVRRSSYLTMILVVVALVQVVVALVDFQFNTIVQQTFPDTDRRTEVIGQVYGAISVATALLHAGSGPILATLGIPASLQSVPVLVGGAFCVFALLPGFGTAALAKSATKCLDYTLFRNAKEALYIPLGHEERTQGKSVVDMLTYRLAKVAASVMVLALGAAGATSLVSPAVVILLITWFAVSLVAVRRFRVRVRRRDESAGSWSVSGSG